MHKKLLSQLNTLSLNSLLHYTTATHYILKHPYAPSQSSSSLSLTSAALSRPFSPTPPKMKVTFNHFRKTGSTSRWISPSISFAISATVSKARQKMLILRSCDPSEMWITVPVCRWKGFGEASGSTGGGVGVVFCRFDGCCFGVF